MKKVLIVLMAVCMLFVFASCSSAGNAASASAPASSAAAPASSEAVSASPSASASAAASASTSASASASASPIEANPNGLTIAAAASLKDVMTEIAKSYTKTSLVFTYGSSGALQTQIEQGAPVDIFMSAGAKQMDALDKEKLLLDGTKSDLLGNKLVMIVPADSKLGLTGFADLATDKVAKIALGDPASVPAGQYAETVLTSMKILDKVKAKAPNYGTDVRQVLTWVESGDVDAGIVYATDALTSSKVKVVAEAPADVAPKITYPVAVLASSKLADDAKDFLAYLKTDDAAKVFEKYGFTVVK